MKILMLCREHPDHFNGGLSIAAWNTARAAAEIGCDVTFVTASKPSGAGHGVEVRDGVRVVWLPDCKHDHYPSYFKALEGFDDLESYDIIHGQGYGAAMIVKRGINKPTVFQDHGSKIGYFQSVINESLLVNNIFDVPPAALQFMRDTLNTNAIPAEEPDIIHMRRYSVVLPTSFTSAMDFRTSYYLTNVREFHHCIYGLDEIQPKKSDGPVVTLFAGELDSVWKVPPKVLDVLATMGDEFTLRLIGRGPVLAARAKTMFKRVEYSGHVPEREALSWLAGSDVLVECAIHHVGCNLTGISALGLGVPVIAFPTGGHWDVVSNSETGIMVDPIYMGAQLPEAVMEVLSAREGYSEAALRLFADRFSPAAVRENLWHIYRGLLE